MGNPKGTLRLSLLDSTSHRVFETDAPFPDGRMTDGLVN
jgi:hypothetical protein